MTRKTIEVFVCSFCGKNHLEVSTLIAGPGDLLICDECVDLCMVILIERRQEKLTAHSQSADGQPEGAA